MAGLNTFKRGNIWRVGAGDMIDIWEDHWIPRSPTHMIFTPKGHVLLQTVNELTDRSYGRYNKLMIPLKSCFLFLWYKLKYIGLF